jgi:hypothetical protein
MTSYSILLLIKNTKRTPPIWYCRQMTSLVSVDKLHSGTRQSIRYWAKNISSIWSRTWAKVRCLVWMRPHPFKIKITVKRLKNSPYTQLTTHAHSVYISSIWMDQTGTWPCLVSNLKNFHPSQRIFRYMHRTLNVDKKTNYTVLLKIKRRIF